MSLRKKLENTFKKHLVNTVLRGRADIQSIEDKFTSGIPDLNLCADGQEVWVELKIIDEWPVRPTTTLGSKLDHLTKEQIVWMRKRKKYGGHVFLFLKVAATREYFLFYGEDAQKVKECTAATAYALAPAYWNGHLKGDELIKELLR